MTDAPPPDDPHPSSLIDRVRRSGLFADRVGARRGASPYPDEAGGRRSGTDEPSWDAYDDFAAGDGPIEVLHEPSVGDLERPDIRYAADPWFSEDGDYSPEDWTKLPKRSSALRRWTIVLSVVSLIVIITFVTAKGWLDRQLDPAGDPTEEVVIDVPEGATTNDIAGILEDEGVVANSTVFRYYLRFKDAGEFQAGRYTFRQNSAVWDARAVLEGGPAPISTIFVTIPEGLRLSSIETTLVDENPAFDRAELSRILRSGEIRSKFQPPDIDTLEGLLFPATYDILEDHVDDEADLIERLVAEFDRRTTALGYDRASSLVNRTPYEVIIVASLIEEEAKIDEDRAKIARVIYNRLAAGDLLGIDATVVYAAGKAPGEPITESDLEIDSPYNTRRNPGLPPTPIAAPGEASLEAALNPADGDWYWYVLTNEGDVDGAHTFAETEAEFRAAVQVCVEKDLGCG